MHETAEQELLELLSCHRSDAWFLECGAVKIQNKEHHTSYRIKIDVYNKTDRVEKLGTEESEGPFPWTVPLIPKIGDDIKGGHSPENQPVNLSWVKRLPLSVQHNPCLQRLVEESASMSCIIFDVPKARATAGHVFQHSVEVLERMFRKHDPCIFKVGFTHDACFRWGNTLYGYANAKEKWAQMTILYITDEPYGPAMLEASLIDKFRSI